MNLLLSVDDSAFSSQAVRNLREVTVRVEWVPYGRAAGEALRRAVSEAKAGEPLAPVTVVVPSNHVGVASRRQLASGALGPVTPGGTGLAATTFLTVYRLAELVGAPSLAAAGRRPVSTPVIAAAVRAALAESPGRFAPVAEHPATEAALVSAYQELRDCTPAALASMRASAGAADVVRLHDAARARLADDWFDEQDLMDAAVEIFAAGGPGVTDLGSVIVHLPQRLGPHAAALLRAAAATTEMHVIAGSTGYARADGDVVTAVQRIDAKAPVEPAKPPTQDPQRTRVITTSDADEEVRAAVRAVVDAARNGTPLARIAVLHASPEPYARLAHEQLRAAGITTNGAAVVPLASRVLGRALLGLLALPEGGFRREDVFTWLAGAPIRYQRRPAPTTAWERLSRDAAIVGGRHDWDEHLSSLADDLDRQATTAEADPDAAAWRGGVSP